MSELAILVERTRASFEEMFAELGLVLLLQRVELALVAIKIVIVALLSQVTQDLARRIVEVALLSILVLRLAGARVEVRALSRGVSCCRGTSLVVAGALILRLFSLRSLRIAVLLGVLFGLGDLDGCSSSDLLLGDVLRLRALGGFGSLVVGRHALNIV